jgi:hypothetical protein
MAAEKVPNGTKEGTKPPRERGDNLGVQHGGSSSLLTNILLGVIASLTVASWADQRFHANDRTIHTGRDERMATIQNEISKSVPPPDVLRRLAEHDAHFVKIEEALTAIRSAASETNSYLARIEELLKK